MYEIYDRKRPKYVRTLREEKTEIRTKSKTRNNRKNPGKGDFKQVTVSSHTERYTNNTIRDQYCDNIVKCFYGFLYLSHDVTTFSHRR